MPTPTYRDYLTARLSLAGYSHEQIDDALLMAEAVNVTLAAGRAAAHGYHRPLRWVVGGHEVEPAGVATPTPTPRIGAGANGTTPAGATAEQAVGTDRNTSTRTQPPAAHPHRAHPSTTTSHTGSAQGGSTAGHSTTAPPTDSPS